MDWSEIELGALTNFLAAPGPLKDALDKFIAGLARQQQADCAACMASVPRDSERAADHAAKAQVLNEFWTILAEQIISFATPLEEPSLEDRRGVINE